MAIAEYGTLDALGLADLVRRRQVSPAELLEEAIARNERVNAKLGAVITTVYDDARRVAGARTQTAPIRRLPAPFAGVPFLVKDIYCDMAGVPATSSSRYLVGLQAGARRDDRRALPQAPAWSSSAAPTPPSWAFCRSTEPELHGPARNPWDPALTAGGSSGGAAAAVAAGHRPARPRQRRRRLDPHPRLLLRPLRPEADARAHPGRPGSLAALERVHDRPRGLAQRPRQRRAARRHRRSRADVALLGAATGAAISRGGGRAARASCGSPSPNGRR